MIINFDLMETLVMKNFKGGEGDVEAEMFNDDLNRIMLSTLKPGSSIGLHMHDTSSEIVYVLEGVGQVIIDGRIEYLKPGVVHYCPKGHKHTIINDSEKPLKVICVVPQQ